MLKDLICAWRVARFPFFLGVDDVRVAADVAQDTIHTEQTFARTKGERWDVRLDYVRLSLISTLDYVRQAKIGRF